MKYRPQNGWTKARIIDALRKYVPEDGCRGEAGGCVYQRGESRCAAGALMTEAQLECAIEGMPIDDLVRGGAIDDASLPLPLDAMERLQARHDGSRIFSRSARARCIKWVNENVEGEP